MTNTEKMIELHKEACEKMHNIMKQKNHDYSGSVDPFVNFRSVEAIGICSTEQGFMTRMMDKVCRISNFMSSGELHVKDESVEDTLMDLANYALLMMLYIKMSKDESTGQTIQDMSDSLKESTIKLNKA